MKPLWLGITIILISALISWYMTRAIPDPLPASGGKLLLRDELLRMSEP